MNEVEFKTRYRRLDGFSKLRPTHLPMSDRHMAAIARAAAIEVLG